MRISVQVLGVGDVMHIQSGSGAYPGEWNAPGIPRRPALSKANPWANNAARVKFSKERCAMARRFREIWSFT